MRLALVTQIKPLALPWASTDYNTNFHIPVVIILLVQGQYRIKGVSIAIVMYSLISQPFWVDASHPYRAAISCYNPPPVDFISEMRCTTQDFVAGDQQPLEANR